MTVGRQGVSRLTVAAAGLLVILGACSERPRTDGPIPSDDAPVVLFFGDSITRGQGLREEMAFPALLQERLRGERMNFRCVNAGVSGDTTTGALARLQPYVDAGPHTVVIELGANDVFRGVDRRRIAANLLAIARAFSGAGAHVIIAGMTFPQMHPALALSMGRVYESVASAAGAELIPDLLEGVVGVHDLNLEDGIHPNAGGHVRLAETVWPVLRRVLLSG